MIRQLLRLLGIAALLAAGNAAGEVAVPALSGRVVDQTATLSPAQIQTLDHKLADLESRKGSQVAVLIVPTTAPETIEQYSIRVADQWKLGRKNVDDGAILLVAKNDHTLRIEVGYGLEGVLPDVTSNRIINEVIVPRFRGGDFYGGINAGLDRMIGAIDGEPLPPPERTSQNGTSNAFNLFPFALVFSLVVGGVLQALFGRIGGALTTGGLVGAITWLFLGTLGIALLAALFASVLTLIPRNGGGPRGWSTPGRYSGWGGGWGGGTGSGGFGSGGGFSGGGGGFGGGGASGRW